MTWVLLAIVVFGPATCAYIRRRWPTDPSPCVEYDLWQDPNIPPPPPELPREKGRDYK